METKIDFEELVLVQVASKIIDSMPDAEKQRILEASLTKTLGEIMKPWRVEAAVRGNVERYMIEYLKKADVQERIKKATENAVDLLMSGVVISIIEGAQSNIKSEYKKFLERGDK